MSDVSAKDVGQLQSARLDLTCAQIVSETLATPTVTPTPGPIDNSALTPTVTPTATPTSEGSSALKQEEADEGPANMIWLPVLLRGDTL